MKFFKVNVSLIFLSLIPLTAYAQEENAPVHQQEIEKLGSDMAQSYASRYEGVKGSPYFTEKWISGEIEFDDRSKYDDVELLYNVYEDELLARDKGGNPVIVNKEIVRSFTMGKNDNTNMGNFLKADYLEYELDDVDDSQYVQELYKGEGALYAVNKKSLGQNSSAENRGDTYDAFTELKADYYFISPSGKIHQLEPEQNSILKAMSARREAVGNYIEEQNLDLNERNDLVELVMFYEIKD
ncbi:hypothetical protein OKW21_000658 [Catalinimonas alkaloidigena]|uniref:hypothetical protein n=1 Tax=Catalinimonas alkaloidigena TaxID=1075417 RepID=UPI0024066CD3|nr:hypothetical protein [Catalinimonas alkaloidigena]MDF9795395.1 hypothetical protein [Catalinimonas alkaloidigena]